MCMTACMFTTCIFLCSWLCLCVSVRLRAGVHSYMCMCVLHTRTLPCEIRLICHWCRRSFMINSPTCWKQCYSALSTCGTYICARVCVSLRRMCVWKCMQIDRDVLLQKRRCGKCHVTQVDWCQNSSMLSVWAFIIYEREPLLWCWQVWHTWSKRALLCVHLLFTTQGIRAIKPTTLTGGWSDSKYFFYNICIHI